MADPQQSGGTPTARPCEIMPLCATLGIEATARRDPDEVVVSMRWEPGLCTTGGVLHGGAVMSLAHAGRTVIVVETEVRDRAGKLVAKTVQPQAVLRAW